MKRFFESIGKVVSGVLGWLAAVMIMLIISGVLVTIGTAALGIFVLSVIAVILVGGIRKLFGLNRKQKVEVVQGGKHEG
jgi:hypothetical protein